MKYFTNWSVYRIKVVIPILHLIYIFLHIDPIFVSLIVSMMISATRIFKVCLVIRQSQLLLFFFYYFTNQQFIYIALLYNLHSAYNHIASIFTALIFTSAKLILVLFLDFSSQKMSLFKFSRKKLNHTTSY